MHHFFKTAKLSYIGVPLSRTMSSGLWSCVFIISCLNITMCIRTKLNLTISRGVQITSFLKCFRLMSNEWMSHFDMKGQRRKHGFATTFSRFWLLNIFDCVLLLYPTLSTLWKHIFCAYRKCHEKPEESGGWCVWCPLESPKICPWAVLEKDAKYEQVTLFLKHP